MKSRICLKITGLWALAIWTTGASLGQNLESGPDNKTKKIFYLGIEQSELLQNRYQNIGIHNFTFFAGQRFSAEPWKKWGWRLLLINVALSEEHLQNNAFIDEPKNGLTGRLTVGRMYIDYYPAEVKKGVFAFAPVISTGLGYNATQFTRNHESITRKAFALPLSLRLSYTFFNTVFFEFPVVDVSFHSRMKKTYLGDTYIHYPETFSIYMWINLGLKVRV